jgi:hypothetical protein
MILGAFARALDISVCVEYEGNFHSIEVKISSHDFDQIVLGNCLPAIDPINKPTACISLALGESEVKQTHRATRDTHGVLRTCHPVPSTYVSA